MASVGPPPPAPSVVGAASGPAAVDPGGQARFLGALDVRLDLPLASVGSRAMAQWVDLWVAGGIVLVVAASTATAGILASELLGEDAAAIVLAASVVLGFLTQWGYFAGFELAWQGQTPGKRMFGLRVVTLDGGVPGPLPVLVRNLVRMVDLLPGIYGVGAITMLLSRRGQRLGDLAAGTVVVREDAALDLEAAGSEHRWPDGLSAREVALLERWERRAPALLPEVRQELAAALVAHLRRTHPGLLPAGEADDRALLAGLRRSGGAR